MVVQDKCRLCEREAELKESHVIPSFVFRWQRATSANGHVRNSAMPNKRAQDGEKLHLLCAECEGRLNKFETTFATRVFHPFASDQTDNVRYGDWLLPFCVSVSWRVLQVLKERGAFQQFSPDLRQRLMEADAIWKSVLLKTLPNPGKFVQHLLPLGPIENSTMAATQPNINRWARRVIEMDFANAKGTAFTYAKLGRFVILGFVQLDRPSEWRGTKVHENEGRIAPGTYTLPREFGDYLFSRARKAAQIKEALSPRQQEVIEQSFRNNVDRNAASEYVRAMQDDVRLFGDKAFSSGGSGGTEAS